MHPNCAVASLLGHRAKGQAVETYSEYTKLVSVPRSAAVSAAGPRTILWQWPAAANRHKLLATLLILTLRCYTPHSGPPGRILASIAAPMFPVRHTIMKSYRKH